MSAPRRTATARPSAAASAPAAAPGAESARPPTLHRKIDGAAVADREAVPGAGAGRIP